MSSTSFPTFFFKTGSLTVLQLPDWLGQGAPRILPLPPVLHLGFYLSARVWLSGLRAHVLSYLPRPRAFMFLTLSSSGVEAGVQ